MTSWLSWPVLAAWAVLALACAAWTIRDLRHDNAFLGGIMKVAWVLTVLYSGPLGLLVYVYSGRGQIRRDSLWRRSFRSVAHCYSGCGLGEILGVLVLMGLLAISGWPVNLATFALAYVIGFGFTLGPLMQSGEPFWVALKDSVVAESLSITAMEASALAVNTGLAGGAGIGEPLFWAALVVSLTVGLLVAYPVNVLLIRFGIKEGMHNPKHMMEHGHHGH
ncbi:DUF4396 domain-containing protein [Alloalcanivorax profundimaris]|uniref:DUF4396 domain-containing protein n=1 Tax=Alloalcanivorax profundimaris TaxID=2735259 RepID=UPI000C4D0DA0|nr:DUF4396 domain-containing protein [Alloalcanivorax profundimaris]MAO60169.1 copper oxidase [Alcanivorax sp.]MBM1143721.1 DUF4396 domain-containing protein [Alcanivorax sp. ZXX171]MCQ6261087.1 DUF4396 domain-containing protein [Alcanivorax sp. MM125-6]UWN51017.1 hypothetical protein ASALC70_03241 [Alcanivorax sp. ALC70]MAY08927.1 copper oxidase [Alcanivorax sp.]